MNFPRAPIPDTNLTSWLSRLVNSTSRLQPGNSDTITVKSTADGIVYEVNDNVIPNKNVVSWGEEYVDGYGYSMGTMIFVKTKKEYTNDSRGVFASHPGIYICTSPVPSKVDLAGFGSGYLRTYYTSENQDPKIVYAPVYPYPSETPAYQTEDGKGQYWRVISFAPLKIKMCVDGIEGTYYMNAVPSGSIA